MLTRLIVLGLLAHQPLSGYAIRHVLQTSQAERWAGILPGSIYHALKTLASEGLVALHETAQTGHRVKTIYAITAAGRQELRRLLEAAWRTPASGFPTGLYAALSFVDDLPRETVLDALDKQIAAAQTELASWNAGEIAKEQATPLPEYARAVFANGREHMEVDLRFLRYLRETLPAAPPLEFTLPLPQDSGERSEDERRPG